MTFFRDLMFINLYKKYLISVFFCNSAKGNIVAQFFLMQSCWKSCNIKQFPVQMHYWFLNNLSINRKKMSNSCYINWITKSCLSFLNMKMKVIRREEFLTCLHFFPSFVSVILNFEFYFSMLGATFRINWAKVNSKFTSIELSNITRFVTCNLNLF